MVGEKGIMLSGGQKQRISLARAMLKPCDLLILDNVLSAVDYETERHLLREIYKLLKPINNQQTGPGKKHPDRLSSCYIDGTGRLDFGAR